MKQWQKHILGLVLPLAVSATTFAFAPEYDTPDWMISVSAAGIAMAIVYAVFLYGRLASRGGNYFIVPATMFIVGVVGWPVGLAQQSAAMTALGGLIPLSGIMLASGYLSQQSGKGDRVS